MEPVIPVRGWMTRKSIRRWRKQPAAPSLYSFDGDIRKNLYIVFGASGGSASINYQEPLLRDRGSEVANEASHAIRIIQSRGR